MTIEPNTKPPRRRRRAKPAHQPDLVVGPCGRKVQKPHPFFAIIFADGAVLWQSHSALSRSGCVDCIADQLVDHHYLKHGNPLRAPFGMIAEGDDGRFGPYGGLDLIGLLARLSAPDALLINNIHDTGEC